MCALAFMSATQLHLMIIWIPAVYLPTTTQDMCLSTLSNLIQHDWTIQHLLFNSVDYSDTIDADRYVFYILNSYGSTAMAPFCKNSMTDMIYNVFDIYLDNILNTDTVLDHIVIDHDNIADGSPTRARIVTVLYPSDNSDLSLVVSSNCILDPHYPALETSPREYDNTVLGR